MSLQSQYVVGLYRNVNPTKTDVATISRAHWEPAPPKPFFKNQIFVERKSTTLGKPY